MGLLLTTTWPEDGGESFWAFMKGVLDEHGAVALMLVVLLLLFYKLIWKVWNAAMQAKDAEINRLVEQRDKYQSLVFENLLTSRPSKPDEGKTNGNASSGGAA